MLKNAKFKVSSVLNKDVKTYGKQFLTDGNNETCWNSDKGTNQFIIIEFSEPTQPKELQIMFQGGFAGKNCELSYYKEDWVLFSKFYPQDINELQTFPVECKEPILKLLISFKDSTDFYGRITIYKLDLK